ncbi:Rho GTPase-activating protein 29 [Acropora cervicornis]|uniref:Rho GTPase-activating protein 29 n=1 Tax=Acropora cervicornis TaxID=6130 RepID=A0AAD9PW56_ACRCE|nr:Rho GTPase-activating protein 29 [Acropora cervicornis]
MQRTKMWTKYSKDIETYVDKRAHLELEYTAKLAKLASATKAAITEESIFVTALEQDIDYAENATKTYADLMSSKFTQPLSLRRNTHERVRKELKERWAKACRKMSEALVNLEKAKKLYIQKQQELEKEESSSAGLTAFARGTKKKEGDLRKADEAEDLYKQSVQEANARQRELESTKSKVLVELRQLVTCNYFQMMNTLASPSPVHFQTLAESSRNYEPGNQFSEFVRRQQTNAPQAMCPVYHFEPYSAMSSDKVPSRQNSLLDARNSQGQAAIEETVKMSPFMPRRHKSLTSHGNVNSVQSPMNAWSHLKENNSDAESTTSRSLPGSPSGSPTQLRKHMPRAQSLEFMSSDDGDNKGDGRKNGAVDPGSRTNSSNKREPSAGPFQRSRLSSAAQTHRLKKLRSASKCRDCDSYVYFNGAECEVQRRMTTFGVDFQLHLQDSRLDVKGIYRVSGVKSRAFENGAYHADLSDTPPHVIAAVLKLYLRQLPESLLTFRLYPEFIRVAKESFSFICNSTTCKDASENEELRDEYDNLTKKLREVVMQLPTANRVTAERLIKHLKRVSEHVEDNAMPGSNLAIVFGPTLLRPCENEATCTLSTLVEMPNQTRLVELLIASPEVFDLPESDSSISRETPVESLRPPGGNQDESYEAGDEASFINTPDTNSSQSTQDLSLPRPRLSS